MVSVSGGSPSVNHRWASLEASSKYRDTKTARASLVFSNSIHAIDDPRIIHMSLKRSSQPNATSPSEILTGQFGELNLKKRGRHALSLCLDILSSPLNSPSGDLPKDFLPIRSPSDANLSIKSPPPAPSKRRRRMCHFSTGPPDEAAPKELSCQSSCVDLSVFDLTLPVSKKSRGGGPPRFPLPP